MTERLLYESMIRVETDHYVCRIWRERKEHQINLDMQIGHSAKNVLEENRSFTEMATEIVMMEDVNSVEITFMNTGLGLCVHRNWP